MGAGRCLPGSRQMFAWEQEQNVCRGARTILISWEQVAECLHGSRKQSVCTGVGTILIIWEQAGVCMGGGAKIFADKQDPY